MHLVKGRTAGDVGLRLSVDRITAAQANQHQGGTERRCCKTGGAHPGSPGERLRRHYDLLFRPQAGSARFVCGACYTLPEGALQWMNAMSRASLLSTALRVANVPKEEFEAAVESDVTSGVIFI
jgi:hypothetical protein